MIQIVLLPRLSRRRGRISPFLSVTPHFAKSGVEPVVHVTDAVVPGAWSGAEVDEPVHRTIRLCAAEGDDDGVGAFGDEALRVGVVTDFLTGKQLRFATDRPSLPV